MTNNIVMPTEMEQVQILYDCRKVWERLNELDDIERTRIKNYFIRASDDRNIRYIAEYFTNKRTFVNEGKTGIGSSCCLTEGRAGIGSSTCLKNEINVMSNPFISSSNNKLYSWNEANINTTFEECLRNIQTFEIIKQFSKFKFNKN